MPSGRTEGHSVKGHPNQVRWVRGHEVVECSRWLLLLIIVASVALWGSTRPWTRDLVAKFLLLDLLIFSVGLVLIGRNPRLPLAAWLPLSAILLQGWIMTLNAFPGPGGIRILLEHVPGKIPLLAASIDRDVSMHSMMLASGLLGALCVSSDMASNRVWLLRLWRTMALAGAGMVFLGLAQRWTHARAIYWNLYENTGEYFFGVFRYHANAGALINLSLPLLAGLACLSLLDSRHKGQRMLWITATVATVAGSFVNVSRAASAITLVLCMMIALILASRGAWRNSGKSLGGIVVPPLLTLTILIAVTWSFGIEKSLFRWTHPGNGSAFWGGDRVRTFGVIIHSLLPRTGIFGSGPGTFEQSFSAVNIHCGSPVAGRWDMAHNDYLQTLADWGLLGFVFWLFLLGGGILNGLSCIRHNNSTTMKAFTIAGILSLGGVLFHALLDFPLQIASLELYTACLAGALWGSGYKMAKGR